MCLDWCQDRILATELHLSPYHCYCCATLGYAISQQGEKAWVFYKWAHSTIDEIEYLHCLYATFEHEPKTKPESRTHPPMTTWDGLDEEVRCLPLVLACKSHLQVILPSLHSNPSLTLNLDDPEGLLAHFLPSVTHLPLQPFPSEQYCSIYRLMAVHLMQVLQEVQEPRS